jgi:hemerythrin-like domain-containing protein
MQATEILKEEHRVIEQVLDCLETLADRCKADGVLDGDSAREALDFLGHFADHCHHGKEEGCLFPLLEAKGFIRDRGPTGVMLHEHEQGRAHIRAMAEALDQAAAGDPAALAVFVAHARAYVTLLREHIQKEDHCLFMMAEQVLNSADARALLESFDRVENHDMGAGTHEHYLALADALASRLGVPRARVGATCGHACCHHSHA